MEQTSFLQRNKTLLITLVILVLLGYWGVTTFNGFVRRGESITAQWAQVENQYQRRFDLIPNIVETVKGVAGQEQEVFGAIAEARTRYSGAQTPDSRAEAATQVESALGRLLVIAENYPVLQSSQSFRDLTTTLEGTENRISVERMKYNELVRAYNSNLKTFPTSVLALILMIPEKEYFDVPTENQAVPPVDFSN